MIDIKEVMLPLDELYNPQNQAHDNFEYCNSNGECIMKIELREKPFERFGWQLIEFSYNSSLNEKELEGVFLNLLNKILVSHENGFYFQAGNSSKESKITKFRGIHLYKDNIYICG